MVAAVVSQNKQAPQLPQRKDNKKRAKSALFLFNFLLFLSLAQTAQML
jgi:hypothetical protein